MASVNFTSNGWRSIQWLRPQHGLPLLRWILPVVPFAGESAWQLAVNTSAPPVSSSDAIPCADTPTSFRSRSLPTSGCPRQCSSRSPTPHPLTTAAAPRPPTPGTRPASKGNYIPFYPTRLRTPYRQTLWRCPQRRIFDGLAQSLNTEAHDAYYSDKGSRNAWSRRWKITSRTCSYCSAADSVRHTIRVLPRDGAGVDPDGGVGSFEFNGVRLLAVGAVGSESRESEGVGRRAVRGV